MNLRPRLALSHGLIIGLLCVISLVALHSIQKLAQQGDMMMSADAEAMQATERIRLQLGLEIAQLMRETLSAHNGVSAQGKCFQEQLNRCPRCNKRRSPLFHRAGSAPGAGQIRTDLHPF